MWVRSCWDGMEQGYYGDVRGQVAMTAEHVRVSVCMHKLVQKDENQATL